MPILVAGFIELSKADVRKILICFVFSCFAFVTFSLARAAWILIQTGAAHFYYKDLVSFTLIHPAYIGLFIAFAIIIVTLELLHSRNAMNRRTRLLAVVFLLFFLVFEFLLTAKIAIISLFLFLNIALYIGVQQQYTIRKAIAMLALMNCIGLGAIVALPYTRERFKLLFTYKEANYTNSVDSRTEIWHSAWQLVRDHNGLGIGSGDSEETLVSYYEKNGFKAGVEARYNTHNQYLQILVETGVGGLLFFLSILGACCWWAIRDRNYLYLAFLLLFMVNIFTESMLKTQSGVVFYAFFNTILGLSGKPK